MAIVAARSAASGNEAKLRSAFPNLRRYEAWDGAGHFLMLESPDRFDRALTEFLTGLR
jgi:pimeloyl-ACP methyl ester carboxylesterase